ncbi:MAG: cyclic nucleotide-binding domain-containing protein [Pseudomonadota bacterium]
MEYFTLEYLIWAIALGAISAVSLPLGSLVGIQTNPRPYTVSTLAAFGAGALIAALSVELVAPTLFALEAPDGIPQHGNPLSNFLALVSGAAAGGIVFTFLDRLVNARGGFLRRASSTISYLTARKRDRELATLKDLAAFPLLKDLPPEHINTLVNMIQPVRYQTGEVIATEGEPGNRLVFIVEGTVAARTGDGLQSLFGEGSVIGVIPLVTDRPHPATGTAEAAIKAYALSKADFQRLSKLSPAFAGAVRELTGERMQLIANLIAERDAKALDWLEKSRQALITGAQIPNELDWRKVREEYKGAPLAIWLGILLDGIPESFVIGAGLLVLLQGKLLQLDSLGLADVVPYTLIAGLFLSNFPEALASSTNMRMQGFSKRKVLLLWFSLLVITALGAGAGFLLADFLSPTWVVFAEGLAAGAMLTMIAGAMIPEAVHMGKASVVGLSTLTGFLAAISFKLLG